jgi:putative redox protein
MVQISIDYTGQLHCSATHGPSKTELVTDAPLDNLGKGEAFSPTDLVATALGTCIATTMGIVAQKHGIDLRGMTVNVTKEMANDPRRIGRLTSEVRIPLPPDHPQRELLEKTGLGCPVHRSLPAEMERPTHFFWEGLAK